MIIKCVWICGVLILAGLVYFGPIQSAHAAECDTLHVAGESGCGSGDGWDPQAQLDNMGTDNAGVSGSVAPVKWPERSREMRWNQPAYGFNDTNTSSNDQVPAKTTQVNQVNATPVKTGTGLTAAAPSVAVQPPLVRNEFQSMLASVYNVSDYDVVLDVSDGDSEYIPGSVHIDYLDFVDDNTSLLLPAPDLAKILSDAGITNCTKVLVNGKCPTCAGGESAATFGYFILRYLGNDDVRLLDGNTSEWSKANHKVPDKTAASNVTLETDGTNGNCTFGARPDLMATYDLVRSGKVQLVDARTSADFAKGNIMGSVNIPFDSVLIGDRIKDEATLKKMFTGLKKDKVVVVYTNTGVKATMVWFALEMLGYDAKVYAMNDWTAHQA